MEDMEAMTTRTEAELQDFSTEMLEFTTPLCQVRGVLCADSDYANFLLGGIEVRVKI